MATNRLSGWRVFLWIYAPLFLWLVVIFYLSSGSGSAAETSRIVAPLIRFFFPDVDQATMQVIHGLVRKTAHVTEYAILAFLASRVVFGMKSDSIRSSWPVLPIILVAATASVDEYNQSLNPQRTGSPWDVLLDIFGGLLALVSIWLFRKRNTT
jgi:VanZ family protein